MNTFVKSRLHLDECLRSNQPILRLSGTSDPISTVHVRLQVILIFLGPDIDHVLIMLGIKSDLELTCFAKLILFSSYYCVLFSSEL